MKEHVLYYYGLENIDNFVQKEAYYFTSDNKLYSLELVENIEKSSRIFNVLQKVNYTKGYRVINNIYGKVFTNISNSWYVLLLHCNENYNIIEDLLHPVNVSSLVSFDSSILWNYLWSKKVDYYEYQFQHINEVYPLICESFNYFIGLAENAISYFLYNVQSLNNLNLFLCHERISFSKYFNPLNVTIDYYARDVAEYIKFLFFSDNYKSFSFTEFFEKLNLHYNDYILLFSRLLFPSYYFDIYDCIIRKKSEESELSKVIFLVDDYYLFLQKIYQTISFYVKIPAIEWIKK